MLYVGNVSCNPTIKFYVAHELARYQTFFEFNYYQLRKCNFDLPLTTADVASHVVA